MKLIPTILCTIFFIISCGKTKENKNNTSELNDSGKMSVVINGHKYDYDAVSGATKEVKNSAEPMKYEEKLKLMFWSGKPAVGYIEGDYYHTDTIFDGGYTALADIVKKEGKLVMVEFDEIAPKDYYSQDWVGVSKRLSGYGFFQASSQRTDATLATLINGFTFLEHQMLSENRLTGDFKSVRGSSNSVRRAFIPMLARLAPYTEKPSGQYYYGLTKKADDGILYRLQVIKEGDKIVNVKYDEIFEDNVEDIKDAELKQFYRQSKYYSTSYPKVMKKDFKVFANQICDDVSLSQDLLKLSQKTEGESLFKDELKNYKSLANELFVQISK